MGVYNSDWLLNQIRGTELMSSSRLLNLRLWILIEVRWETIKGRLLMEMFTLMIC